MRRFGSHGLVLTTLLAACNGGDGTTKPVDGGGGGNAGFRLPTAVAAANQEVGGVWNEVGVADWSCLGTPSADQPSTQSTTLSGTAAELASGAGVGGATLVAFAGIDSSGNLGSATTSDSAATRGDYAMVLAQLPSGITRYGLRIDGSGLLRTYVFNLYFDPADATQTFGPRAISETTANAFAAAVSVTRDAAEGMVLGTMRDCAGREVSNVVATVSSAAGAATHLVGAQTFYFSTGVAELPLTHAVAATTNPNGRFMVAGLPPQTAPAFIQVWGFLHGADLAMGEAGLTLLAELPVPIEANAVITASLEPTRL